MRICINTQTPPVRFNLGYSELLEKYGSLGDPLDIGVLERGSDYDYTPGGVTAMNLPLLRKMSERGDIRNPLWVSLGVNYPPRVMLNDVLVSHIELSEEHMRNYSTFKEVLWASIHDLKGPPVRGEEYRGYAKYNWVNAEKLLEYVDDIDVFFVQDFQLLLTGQLIGVSAPAVLRWHVPFRSASLGKLHRYILKAMEGFDSVVVSTRRDLEGLIKSSYHGRAYQVYPHIDRAEWSAPTTAISNELLDRIGLAPDEEFLLTVGRMDPMKSQDIAIRAMARIKNVAKLKLVLVGDGSFSSTRAGGLGQDKGALWRGKLKETARSLGVDDRVVFLGYTTHEQLQAAYRLASAVLLPSRIEGFGITVLEAWINKKPVIVSKGAGSSELVVDGSNGFTFEPEDEAGLAQRILDVLKPGAEQMGENGFETSKQCLIEEAAVKTRAVLEETRANF